MKADPLNQPRPSQKPMNAAVDEDRLSAASAAAKQPARWRGAARGVALGLILMSIFTALWAGWATPTPAPLAIQLVTTVFWLVSALFLINGIYLMITARRLPQQDSQVGNSSPGSRLRRRFWLVFALEGIVIGIVCGVLNGLHQFEFSAPAVSVVVGIHFFPMAWVFQRRRDIVLGAITIAVGLFGLLWVAFDRSGYQAAWTFVGYATASITTIYGVAMLIEKRAFRPSASRLT